MKLRTSFLVGLPTIAICAALMVGLLVLKLRLPEIEAEQRQRAEAQIKVLVDSVDNLLSTYEASLKLASVGLESGANAQFELNSLKRAEPAFSLVYVADKLGEVKFIGKEKDRSHATTIVLPVKSLRALRESATRSGTGWSNQFLSIASGETVIGLGRPTGEGMLIAELLPSSLKDTVANVAAGIDLPMIIIDGNGAMVSANTATFGGRFDNFANVPALRNAMDGIAGGQFATPESSFHIVSSKSKKLGWTYVIGLPLGISNVDYRRTIFVVGLGVLGASFIALMFAPWLSTIFARPLVRLREHARKAAKEDEREPWLSSAVEEIQELSRALQAMVSTIRTREQELSQLNAALESKVDERTYELTKSNEDLHRSMELLKATQDQLVRQEKLAGLGRLVAGVSHEMNTPLGNALLSVTTISGKISDLTKQISTGQISRSGLNSQLDFIREGAQMLEGNLVHAANLVGSFKQTSADQIGGKRRTFGLQRMVDEMLTTIAPTVRKSKVTISSDIAPELQLDSFPGAILQILTNLIMNAIFHGFEGRTSGEIRISAVVVDKDFLEILVKDDGRGIDPAIVSKIFDPFFTTKMGRGGTGLGLNISYNLATMVLGGSISVFETSSAGTQFMLRIPLHAPAINNESMRDALQGTV